MWALVLAAVGLTIGVLLHGYRLQKTNIPKWAYEIVELCRALQFQHEGRCVGTGVFCLNIQPGLLTAAFPVQEAWAEQVILKPCATPPPPHTHTGRWYAVSMRCWRKIFLSGRTVFCAKRSRNWRAECWNGLWSC